MKLEFTKKKDIVLKKTKLDISNLKSYKTKIPIDNCKLINSQLEINSRFIIPHKERMIYNIDSIVESDSMPSCLDLYILTYLEVYVLSYMEYNIIFMKYRHINNRVLGKIVPKSIPLKDVILEEVNKETIFASIIALSSITKKCTYEPQEDAETCFIVLKHLTILCSYYNFITKNTNKNYIIDSKLRGNSGHPIHLSVVLDSNYNLKQFTVSDEKGFYICLSGIRHADNLNISIAKYVKETVSELKYNLSNEELDKYVRMMLDRNKYEKNLILSSFYHGKYCLLIPFLDNLDLYLYCELMGEIELVVRRIITGDFARVLDLSLRRLY